ncbi:hypothetical protein KSF73_11795 [Burkholderiaceae bacterium DAT-1]|nr:hypothetical protein [Burkholderiaceae bacterium DAT-1]
MTMFFCECHLIENQGGYAVYRFFPDRFHAAVATGTVRVNSENWSYAVLEPSNGEEQGSVSSDEGCMKRLIPKILAAFQKSGAWPETARHLS